LALFSLLSSTYGGNGTTTFALPDLDGRIAVGTDNGTNWPLGFQTGTEQLQLNSSQIPVLPTLPEPASLSILALGGGAMLRRRRA
jgi:microcystin-dependent protein